MKVTNLSQKLKEHCSSYVGDPYQNYIVAKIIASKQLTTVAVIPTGAGKTFICALLQMYYQTIDVNSAIVASQQYLVEQAE